MKTTVIALATMFVVLGTHAASAQRSATTKALGTAYDMWSSGVYLNHALDHSRVIRNYAAVGDQVPQEVARHHSTAVRSSLTAAEKSYDSLAEAHQDDQTVAKHLETLHGHHAKALAAIDKIDAATSEGNGKAKAVGRHSAAAARSLRQAKAEHNKLMKHLKVENPTAGAKGKGGKGKRKAKTPEAE
jgi:hypothetical protein